MNIILYYIFNSVMSTYYETDETLYLRQIVLDSREYNRELIFQRNSIYMEYFDTINNSIDQVYVDSLYLHKLSNIDILIRIARSELHNATENARSEYLDRTQPTRDCDLN
jgi:hypothetical protein